MRVDLDIAMMVDVTRKFMVSTDGWNAYRYGVPFALGSNVDFGMLIKSYASTQVEKRYSPAQIIAAERRAIFGTPNPDEICTSHVESFNQKMRMHLKRFTRLTNAHSKSLKHHEAMQHIFFAFHNFIRPHMSLDKKTPAMASGLTERPLELVELLAM